MNKVLKRRCINGLCRRWFLTLDPTDWDCPTCWGHKHPEYNVDYEKLQ